MSDLPPDNKIVKKAFLSSKGARSRRKDIVVMVLALSFVLFPTSVPKGYGESMSIIDDIRKIESKDIKCNERSAEYYGYLKGRIPVLISAPHGAKHYRTRENRWKAEDAYTSSLAIKLGQLTGAHVIYARNKAAEDPNNDPRSRYKDFMGKIARENGIKFIIDIHGAGRDRPYKIDVGIMDDRVEKCSCPTFKPIIERAFQDFDGMIFNKQFQAKGRGTITHFAKHDLGIEAAQFEIHACYRVMESESNPAGRAREQDVLDLVGRMQTMILDINKNITKDPAGHSPAVPGIANPR